MDIREPYDVDFAELELAPARTRRRELPSHLLEIASASTCVSCGTHLDWDPIPRPSVWRWLFCTEACSQEAKFIRYWRATAKDGRQDSPEVVRELRLKEAIVLGGGYPAERRRLSSETRALVVARDQGRCRQCGRPGTEVDHIEPLADQLLNDPSNLQLLCTRCHREKTEQNLVRIDDMPTLLHSRQLEDRRIRPEPVTFADDEEQFEKWWQLIASERRRRRLADLG